MILKSSLDAPFTLSDIGFAIVADAVSVHEHGHWIPISGVSRSPGTESPEAVSGTPRAAERAVLSAHQTDLATPHPAQNRCPGNSVSPCALSVFLFCFLVDRLFFRLKCVFQVHFTLSVLYHNKISFYDNDHPTECSSVVISAHLATVELVLLSWPPLKKKSTDREPFAKPFPILLAWKERATTVTMKDHPKKSVTSTVSWSGRSGDTLPSPELPSM